MSVPNTTYRVLVEKLGDSDPSQFIGNEGEVFYDPNNPELKLSDGSTPGGLTIAGGGVSIESGWTPTVTDTHTTRQVIIGQNSTVFTENLVVEGNARVTGILSVGTSTIILDPSQDTIAIGTAIILNASTNTIEIGGSIIGDSSGDAYYVGVVTATSFSGSASGLTGFSANQTSNVGVVTYSSQVAITTYNAQNARVFLHEGTLSLLNWTANFTNLDLNPNEATIVRILGSVGGSESNLSAVQIDGSSVGVTSYGLPMKGIKNKTGTFVLVIVKNSGPGYRVYGESANFF